MTLTTRSNARMQTRKKIIKDCATVMKVRGYCNVSIPEIEKATGKTKAILYGYFSNRHDITMAVLNYNLEQNQNAIDDLVNNCVDNRSKLNAHIQFHYPKTEYDLVGNSSELFRLAIEADSAADDEMRKKVAKTLLIWRNALVEIIESGVKINEFKQDTLAEDIAWQLISLIESATIVSKNTQSRKLGLKLLDQANAIAANL